MVNETEHERAKELQKVSLSWSQFSEACWLELRQKTIKGRRGWDDPKERNLLMESFAKHAARALRSGQPQDWIDVGVLSMFLWHHAQGRRETSDD